MYRNPSNLHIHELVQERRNSSALAMELRISYTNPSISVGPVALPNIVKLMNIVY